MESNKYTFIPSEIFSGSVRATPSKSYLHRYLFCSAIYGTGSPAFTCVTDGSLSICDDVNVTVNILNALGGKGTCVRHGGGFDVWRIEKLPKDTIDIFCGECGTSLRFALPAVAVLAAEYNGQYPKTFLFHRGKGLSKRPVAELCNELSRHGFISEELPDGTIKGTGALKSGDYVLPGNISSQYISGLLIALPFLGGKSTLTLKSNLESAPYVRMTLGVLHEFGVHIKQSGDTFYIGEKPRKTESIKSTYKVPGDFSQAANALCAGLIGRHPVTVTGLSLPSVQGDAAFIDIARQYGGRLDVSDGNITAFPSRLHGTEINATDVPDLVPILAVLAAAAEGMTVIRGIERLKYKESNRISGILGLLQAAGAKAESTDAVELKIFGGKVLHSFETDGEGDHRLAMAAAVLSLLCGEVTLKNTDCITKSCPTFVRDFERLNKGLQTERN